LGYEADERARWDWSPSAAGGGKSEGDSVQRSKKLRKSESPKVFSGTANWREAITRRSLVRILPPQPPNSQASVWEFFLREKPRQMNSSAGVNVILDT